MSEKRFILFKSEITDLWVINDNDNKYTFAGMMDKNNAEKIVDLLNKLNNENQAWKHEKQIWENRLERKDRQLQRAKKDTRKYTDYFMNELNWDCDRIIEEVFR